MRIDLHCHTEASYDCSTPFMDVIERCQQQGIQVQAITDHNVISGAQTLQTLVDTLGLGQHLQIIVGEEISTREGELIGLFLKEVVREGLSAEATVEAIHSQGGLVLLPHGFDPLKRHRLRPTARRRIAGSIDIVESFNARISTPIWNRVAAQWASAHGLPCSAGSDAHTAAEVGTAWTASNPSGEGPLTGPDLLALLQHGQVGGHWTHPVAAWIEKLRSEHRRHPARQP